MRTVVPEEGSCGSQDKILAEHSCQTGYGHGASAACPAYVVVLFRWGYWGQDSKVRQVKLGERSTELGRSGRVGDQKPLKKVARAACEIKN